MSYLSEQKQRNTSILDLYLYPYLLGRQTQNFLIVVLDCSGTAAADFNNLPTILGNEA